MLHTSLVAAMAVGAFGNARQDSLLDLMPPDAGLVMEIGDLHSILSLPMEERGDWMRFVTDERVQALLDLAVEEEDAEVPSMALVGEMAAEIKGGAIALVDMEQGPFVGAFHVTDEFEEVLLAFCENVEMPLVEDELLGKRALVDEIGTLAFVETDGLTLMIVTDPGDAEAMLDSMLNTMEDGPDQAGWWSEMYGGLDRSIAQVYLEFAAIPADDDPDFALAAEIIKAIHLDFNAGEGHEGGMSLSMEFHENDVVEAFMDAASGEADHSLLLMAPDGAESIQSAKMDVSAFIDALLLLADSVEPGAGAVEGYEAGLEAGSTFLGIDIQEDLLDNLTGDIFGFQWFSDLEALVSDDLESFTENMPVLGFGISDPEPFIELFEIIEPFAAEVNGTVTDENDITTFSAELMPGIELLAQVSPNYLYIAADRGRLADTLAREGAVKADGAVDDKTYKLAMETMTGPGVAIWDITIIADMMMMVMEEDETVEVPDELYDALDAFSDHIHGIGMNDFQFASHVATFRMMTR